MQVYYKRGEVPDLQPYSRQLKDIKCVPADHFFLLLISHTTLLAASSIQASMHRTPKLHSNAIQQAAANFA